MKEFVAPSVIDLEISETAEGVYAGSGSISDNPSDVIIPPSSSKEWSFDCTWTGHDHGGHSVCHVQATHSGCSCGSCLVMNFSTNFTIKEVKNASGLSISNVGTNSFTLTRNNHFNPTENVGFNFEIITSDMMYDESGNPLHGAIGTNNVATYHCKVSSFTCS